MLDAINVALAKEGKGYRVAYAEYITAGESNEVGQTIYARNVGNKQLDADFVPFDPRRAGWSGPVTGSTDDITYAIDQTGDAVPPFGGLTGAQTTGEIAAAMSTWNAVGCSSIPLIQNPDYGLDLGYTAWAYFGVVGSPYVVADIMHAGWRDLNFAGGILGVTFTWFWVDGSGNPTDIDNNGKLDVAFRDIYYDPSWSWKIGSNMDVQSIALHEAGHGLSQAHFGKVFVTNSNGKLHFSPRAVMNAGYVEVQQELLGTDVGGHCSIWASWPMN